MNSLGLRHTGCGYRRSVPIVSDQPDACDYQSHGPWYRQGVPMSTKWCRAAQPPGTTRPQRMPDHRLPSPTSPQETRTPSNGIVEASRAKPTKPRVPVTNQSHGLRYRRSVPKSTTTPDGKYRRSVPTDGNLARTSPRKPRAPNARYHRSVPSETSHTTCASLPTSHTDHGVAGATRDRQRSPQSLLEGAALGRSSQCGTRYKSWVPYRPAKRLSLLECAAPGRSSQCGTHSSRIRQHLGPSWSVRHLAAPRSVGSAVSAKTTPPNSECILLLSRPVTVAPANSFNSSGEPSKEAFADRLTSNRQRRDCRHVRFRFLQSLVELCTLILKRLLKHR